MIIRTSNSIVLGVLLALIFILGLSSFSWGAEFWLRAETLTKTMPDASVVTMWGFAQCDDSTYSTCGPATVPGPRLTVPAGDTVLTINLRNNLTGPFVEPISIVIPGQAILPAPAWNPDGRARSFTTETPPDNATTVTYIWNNIKPGTYLYESGTHPAVQVQMGLYGAVTSDTAAGQAYGLTTAYVNEVILLFSEIDPVLHNAVATNNYGPGKAVTSTMNYEPRYFLINGEPYSSTTGDIAAGLNGENLLLRFLNAGLKHRVPTINGLTMSLVAEDGSLYPYPKEQYSLLLSPGKTMDAIVTAPGGRFPVYDRRLGLKNNASPSGGMLRHLYVVDTIAPTGSVVINGNAPSTNNQNVILTLHATDVGNALTDMQFSWDGAIWSGWMSYATTANETIPAGTDGIKTIYVNFRDATGNVSSPYSDSILFDTTPPTGSVSINGGAAETSTLAVTLTLSATDVDSAVTDMQFSWDGTTWLSWEVYATTRNISIPAGPNGIKTVYVQFRDAAGNVSSQYSSSISLLDTTLPTGLVVINGDAATTSNLAVTLTLNAIDENAVTDMQFSWDGTTWLGWEAYTTTRNISIPAGPAGIKTVYVQFRDAAGNVSATYSDSITYVPPVQLVAPTDLSAAMMAANQVRLRWTDLSTGETNHRIQRATNAAGTNWTTVTTTTPLTSTGTGGVINIWLTATLNAGTNYRYRVAPLNGATVGPFSNVASVNLTVVPAAPSNLNGSAVRIAGNSTLDRATLNWTNNTNNESGYQIQRAMIGGTSTTCPAASSASWIMQGSVGANVTTYSQNVSRANNFCYRVRGTNAVGNSAWSNVRLVTTP